MVHALLLLAADAATEPEKSETPFYIVGVLFGVWAVVIGTLGLRSPSFGATQAAGRAITGVSVLLALATGALILYVST